MADRLKLKPNEFMDQRMINELNQEGFTDYMIYSFLESAREFKTTISSRLPGKVGLDLIETGYDLKGYQIKAKSCNWGPMAGFICKLPPFNKYGSDKIDYNAYNIFYYLDCLDKFSGQKVQLVAIEASLTEAKTYLSDLKATDIDSTNKIVISGEQLTKNFTEDSSYQVAGETFKKQVYGILNNEQKLEEKKEALKQILNKAFNQNLYAIIKAYRTTEQESGKWSGENTIDPSTPTPFIHLKRVFDPNGSRVADKVKVMQGVDPESVIHKHIDKIGSVVYGRAGNVTDETIAFNITNSTVVMEFLLVQQNTTDLWAMYHGEIFYKSGSEEFKAYAPGISALSESTLNLFPKTIGKYPIVAVTARVTSEMAERNRAHLKNIVQFASTPAAINDVEGLRSDTPFSTTNHSFYPIQGFVNSHPPYKFTHPEYFKNAVSGDYDTFAYWPASTVSAFELTRLSEKMLDQSLKLYPDAHSCFGIEFIPGFDELNPSSSSPLLKESAEVGNVNGIGNLVAGALNSLSSSLLKQYFKLPALNKAFHSDEGGRPGIMEIEFPIAVFFPEPVSTTALNNLYVRGTLPKIPVFTGRARVKVDGGLLKTPEEFLGLMLDLRNQTGKIKMYQVLVQSEWITHLCYISLPERMRTSFTNKTDAFKDFFDSLKLHDSSGELFVDDALGTNAAKQLKNINEKLTEFKKIEANHALIYPVATNFNQPDFESALQSLLNLKGNNMAFIFTRKQFLILAFQSNRAAQKKMLETMGIIYNVTATLA